MADSAAPGKYPWKHLLALMIWLCVVPPVGLYKLWQDDSLSAANKWRVLVYLCVIPLLAYAAVNIWITGRSVQRLMP